MAGTRITPEQRARLFRLVYHENQSIRQAAGIVGMSYSAARYICKGYNNQGQVEAIRAAQAYAGVEALGRPKTESEMTPEARRGLEDFSFFRQRYMGRVTPPWQLKAALQTADRLADPNETYDLWNMAPSVGKTTLAHDIAAWSLTKERRLKVSFGSVVARNAERQGERLRRTFERSTPIKASLRDRTAGLAVDAESTLALDYGIYRPMERQELWRANEFVVVQEDGTGGIDQKEASVTCIGKDTGFIGNRFDLIFWDDLQDKKMLKNAELMEELFEWWDDVAENRLDPGGALFLIGQRLGSKDIYNYVLTKHNLAEAVELGIEDITYRHTIFAAHDDEACVGKHGRDDPAQGEPDGCLLDPKRLPYAKLMGKKLQNPNSYNVVYQQQDGEAGNTLVKRLWIDGGTDPETGVLHYGCWDTDRLLCDLPADLTRPLLSVASVDPSVAQHWALQWSVYAPEAAKQLFLMDLADRKMTAGDLLDYRVDGNKWVGLMEEWQVRSKELGLPIKYWIVEINTAQKYLLQYDHVRRWCAHHDVSIIPHTTARNKSDETLGIESLSSWYSTGRMRLPGGSAAARQRMKPLVDQLCAYPLGTLTDQVMANWFTTFRVPTLVIPKPDNQKKQKRASWLPPSSYPGRAAAAKRKRSFANMAEMMGRE